MLARGRRRADFLQRAYFFACICIAAAFFVVFVFAVSSRIGNFGRGMRGNGCFMRRESISSGEKWEGYLYVGSIVSRMDTDEARGVRAALIGLVSNIPFPYCWLKLLCPGWIMWAV